MIGAVAVAAAITRTKRRRYFGTSIPPTPEGSSAWSGYGPNPNAQLPPLGATHIGTSDNAANIINAAPAGTTFSFESGVHRITSGLPIKAGNTYWGQDGAVINGSKVLTGAISDGSRWYYTGQTQEQWLGPGECTGGGDLCRRSDDVYFNDAPLARVGSLGEVTSGTFYFDYAADRIYIGDDPAGQLVEAAVASNAFQSNVNDVTIRNLTVEKFANAAQRGAIAAKVVTSTTTYGEHWLIQDCVIRLNHGLGVNFGVNGSLVNCFVTENGQMGVAGGESGGGGLMEGCEVSFNKYAGYNAGWEGGGTKFSNTVALQVRGNWVHDNLGFALWTDINNDLTVYEENLVEDNDGVGIFHEISYAATIRNNIVRGNGRTWSINSYGYVFGCGILVANSRDVEIYGNTVGFNEGGGICGVEQTRGGPSEDPWILLRLNVHDNDVTLEYNPDRLRAGNLLGVDPHHGVYQSTGSTDVFTSRNNVFQNNTYRSSNPTGNHFSWLNAQRTFSYWQGTANQDTTGSISAPGTEFLLGVGSSSTSLTDYPKLTPVFSGDKYVDASVASSGNGDTLASAYKTIQEGLSAISSGQTLVVKGGNYVIGSQLTRNVNWPDEVRIVAYGEDRPVLDATGIAANTSAIRFGSNASRETWHGFHVKNVPDAGAGFNGQGIYIDQSSRIKLSDMWVSHCQQTGIELYSADDCTIQDCRIWRLGDGTSVDTNSPDGVAVTGAVGNPSLRAAVVRTAVANAPDDGFDFFRAQNSVFVDCVAYECGFYWNGNPGGDGNGFKLGGNSDGNDNTIRGSIAIGCDNNGLDGNLGDTISFLYCTSVGNGALGIDANGDNASEDNTVTGVISLGNTTQEYTGANVTDTFNTWNLGISNASFADTGAFDWSLGSGSACIGAGPGGENIGASDVALLLGKNFLVMDLTS